MLLLMILLGSLLPAGCQYQEQCYLLLRQIPFLPQIPAKILCSFFVVKDTPHRRSVLNKLLSTRDRGSGVLAVCVFCITMAILMFFFNRFDQLVELILELSCTPVIKLMFLEKNLSRPHVLLGAESFLSENVLAVVANSFLEVFV